MEKRIIPISLPSMGQEEWEATKEPIFSGWITQGPKVAEFEKIFAQRHKVKHAIAERLIYSFEMVHIRQAQNARQ